MKYFFDLLFYLRSFSRKIKLIILGSIDLAIIISSLVIVQIYFFDQVVTEYKFILMGALFGLITLYVTRIYSEILSKAQLANLISSIILSSIIANAVFFINDFSQLEPFIISSLLSSMFLFLLRFIGTLRSKTIKKRIAIYGAGSAGTLLDSALSDSNTYENCFFIDDKESLIGRKIQGKPVISPHEIKKAINRFNLNEIILVIPSISSERKSEIIKSITKLDVKIKTVPSLDSIVSGKKELSDFMPFSADDLLGRSSVVADKKLLEQGIKDEIVLVTGAGGSIGGELSEQIVELKPKKLILLDNSEHALYQIDRRLKKYNNEHETILGSILDKKLLDKIFTENKVTVVFHAAAYKHVPLVEKNIFQAVSNNIFGTLNLVENSEKNNIKKFILISSDKAVRPTNIMGATKRFCELILQAKANITNKDNPTTYSMVRFGNVLGSSGSVVPLFKEQILSGGPITLTDKEVTRYFMSISEAAELVIQSSSMAVGGDVFVLDMGDPVKIYDLALSMIKFSGHTLRDSNNLDGDIAIEIIGLRPGEKLFEELHIGDNVKNTIHLKIMRCNEAFIKWEKLNDILIELKSAIEIYNNNKVLEILNKHVDGFNHSKT